MSQDTPLVKAEGDVAETAIYVRHIIDYNHSKW